MHITTSDNRAAVVRLLALDVDGVLTDDLNSYGNSGGELKAFNIKDGLGIKLLQKMDAGVAIITGRQSEIVIRRAYALGSEDVVQGREDKRQALLELCQRHSIRLEECAYMGDDLPDLSAIIWLKMSGQRWQQTSLDARSVHQILVKDH